MGNLTGNHVLFIFPEKLLRICLGKKQCLSYIRHYLFKAENIFKHNVMLHIVIFLVEMMCSTISNETNFQFLVYYNDYRFFHFGVYLPYIHFQLVDSDYEFQSKIYT